MVFLQETLWKISSQPFISSLLEDLRDVPWLLAEFSTVTILIFHLPWKNLENRHELEIVQE